MTFSTSKVSGDRVAISCPRSQSKFKNVRFDPVNVGLDLDPRENFL